MSNLKGKVAIVFGAGGSLGTAIASAFSDRGAQVVLSGRTQASLEKTAATISSSTINGGFADVENKTSNSSHQVSHPEIIAADAMDAAQVQQVFDKVVDKFQKVDICINLIGLRDSQGIDIADMNVDDFVRPVETAMRTHFLTSAAAARIMRKQKQGVILFLTASPAGLPWPQVGGFGPACSAIEGFARNLATELGPHGVRVAAMRSAGSPDSKVFMDALAQDEAAHVEIDSMKQKAMLRRLPLMHEIANVACFLASDQASGMTGTVANVTCGTTRD